MDKRYQVFISSTYADLQEERQRVIQTVMKMDCIPAGMELFPAADEEQFEFIKRVIDDCDYYLLIIGGRYGSTTADGISYTEKEYDYAMSRRLKVIALIHKDPDSIPYSKSEQNPNLRERLQKFRERVAANRIVDFWKSADQLPGLVALALANIIKTFPAAGWVRGDRVASEDLLAEINELRKSNSQLQENVAELAGASRYDIPDLAGLDETMEIHGTNRYAAQIKPWSVKLTWRQIFGYVAPYLDRYPADSTVKSVLTESLYKQSAYYSPYGSPSWEDQEFRTVSIQLKALGLVNVRYTEAVDGGMGLFWSLTPAGEHLMMEIRVVRKSSAVVKPS
ncbi:MAG: DUF4062 domain-containing protein [Acidobacteriia bacterium]|nr:DUF4062 domain-containing protein [Terriglobia bacterium]